MKLSILNILFAFCSVALAQLQQPTPSIANVEGVMNWYIADLKDDKSCYLKSMVAANSSIYLQNASNHKLINYNPALQLNNESQVIIDLGKNNMHRSTYFIVYQSTYATNEETIWYLEKNGRATNVLTTQRLADLEDTTYMNFTDLEPQTPKINIYQQKKQRDTSFISSQNWNIGGIPREPNLPLHSFQGSIGELLAFDRVLNREEKLRISSHLALKYGITLSESSGTYVNSAGQTVWNGQEYPSFHNNIAGIGRDDATGWYQRSSTSSNEPSLLSISTEANIDNYNFLIWGDNNQSLSQASRLSGLPNFLKRKWMINSYGMNRSIDSEVTIDTKRINVPVPPQPVYWLAVDTTGTADFSNPHLQYIKMKTLDEKGFAHFDVSWSQTPSNQSAFSLFVAQDLLLVANIIAPSCDIPNSGELNIKILGGKPPYQLELRKNNEILLQHEITYMNHNEVIRYLTPGKYFVKVIDASSREFEDSFYLNYSNALEPTTIAESYDLFPGESLHLNASNGHTDGTSYEWKGPNNFVSYHTQVSIQELGRYRLTVISNGCPFVKEFEVNAPPKNIFNDTSVLPNPSGGEFYVKAILDKPAPIEMTVIDPLGRKALIRKGKGNDSYVFQNSLAENGIYHIILQSGKYIKTEKLIIVK